MKQIEVFTRMQIRVGGKTYLTRNDAETWTVECGYERLTAEQLRDLSRCCQHAITLSDATASKVEVGGCDLSIDPTADPIPTE